MHASCMRKIFFLMRKKNYSITHDDCHSGLYQWLMQPQTMEQLMAILAERDAAIQERDLALSEKKSVLAQRDLAILERDAAVVERDNALLERDNVIATLRYRGNSMNSYNW